MKQLFILVILALTVASCSKKEEKAMKINGMWDIEETIITNYINNEPQQDSIVDQQGRIIFTVTGGLDNDCVHNLSYGPCIQVCSWDLPRKKLDQLFFYSYDEYAFEIYASSCMVEKLTRKKLELVKISYDNDLNILQKSVWKFRRAEL